MDHLIECNMYYGLDEPRVTIISKLCIGLINIVPGTQIASSDLAGYCLSSLPFFWVLTYDRLLSLVDSSAVVLLVDVHSG